MIYSNGHWLNERIGIYYSVPVVVDFSDTVINDSADKKGSFF